MTWPSWVIIILPLCLQFFINNTHKHTRFVLKCFMYIYVKEKQMSRYTALAREKGPGGQCKAYCHYCNPRVVPVFDLKEVADKRIGCKATDKIGLRLSKPVRFTRTKFLIIKNKIVVVISHMNYIHKSSKRKIYKKKDICSYMSKVFIEQTVVLLLNRMN